MTALAPPKASSLVAPDPSGERAADATAERGTGATAPRAVGPALDLAVVVPTTRPDVLVRHLLPALGRCDPPPAEIVVVLDGCTAELPDRAGTVPVRALALAPRQGPAAARNAGVESAHAELVLFVDDDVLLAPDLPARAARTLALPGTVAVTGTFAAATGPGAENFCSRYKNDYMGYVCGGAPALTRTLLTAVCAVRRADFLAAGGFDRAIAEATVEDIELGQRLALRGAVRFDPTLQVVHLKRYTPLALVTSHFRRSRDMARLLLAKSLTRRLRELAHSQDALSLPAGFGAGVALVGAALMALVAGPALLYWRGGPPALAVGTAACCLWAAVAVNLPFVRFLGRRRGATYALAGGLVLLGELGISVLAAPVGAAGLLLRRRRVR